MNVQESYSVSADISLKYVVLETVNQSPWDWIGLFRVGWLKPKDFITYQYIKPTISNKLAQVKFARESLGKDEEEFYVFAYVTTSNCVKGVSVPFQITTGGAKEKLVEIDKDVKDGFCILDVESKALKDQLEAKENQIQKLHNEMSIVIKREGKKQHENDTLKSQLLAKNEEIKRLISERCAVVKREENTSKRYQKTLEEYSNLERQLVEKDEQISSVVSQRDFVSNELAESFERFQKIVDENDRLKDELSQNNEKLVCVGEAMSLMEGGCRELQIRLDDLNVKNEQIDEKAHETDRTDHPTSASLCASSGEEIFKFFTNQKCKMLEARDLIGRLSGENEDLTKKVEHLMEELRAKNCEVQTLKNETKTTKNRFETAQKEKSRLLQVQSEVVRRGKQLKVKNEQLRDACCELKTLIDHVHTHVTQLATHQQLEPVLRKSCNDEEDDNCQVEGKEKTQRRSTENGGGELQHWKMLSEDLKLKFQRLARAYKQKKQSAVHYEKRIAACRQEYLNLCNEHQKLVSTTRNCKQQENQQKKSDMHKVAVVNRQPIGNPPDLQHLD